MAAITTAPGTCVHGPADSDTSVCPACAEDQRCEFCNGPTHRISLVDGTIEGLDHRECQLLGAAS